MKGQSEPSDKEAQEASSTSMVPDDSASEKYSLNSTSDKSSLELALDEFVIDDSKDNMLAIEFVLMLGATLSRPSLYG